jgi:hypothetical protein
MLNLTLITQYLGAYSKFGLILILVYKVQNLLIIMLQMLLI